MSGEQSSLVDDSGDSLSSLINGFVFPHPDRDPTSVLKSSVGVGVPGTVSCDPSLFRSSPARMKWLGPI